MNDTTAAKLFSNETKFARFMNTLADVLGIGILWLLCSAPIVTAGAAATAAYYAMAKSVRYSEGRPAKEFFRSFRRNLKQTIPVTILFFLAAGMLAVDLIYLWGNESTKNDAIFVVLVLASFVLLSVIVYFFPLLSRFDKRNPALLRTAFIAAFRYFPLTIGLIACLFWAVIGMYLMPWAVLVIPGTGMYVFTFPMERVLKTLAPPAAEGSEEAEKWYYRKKVER